MMGTAHLLLLLIYLDPLCVLSAANKKSKSPPARVQRVKDANGSSTAVPRDVPRRVTQVQAPSVGSLQHDTCLGYYDVSGQFDKEFACNNTDHRFCCGSCFLRFCCEDRAKRLEQRSCNNYNTPDWIKTQPPSPAPTGDTYDPELDQTNATVYITCGVIALVIAVGISAKVAYDKATKPPQEMNVHRALADILRQQGPVPISQYEHENMAALNGSPKDETPVRTAKNHYTPVHSNHGHYGKENFRSGGPDLHNFISSGFVTLGRGHLKAQHSMDEPSWQDELDVPISYGDKDMDDYYPRKHHHQDFGGRGPTHMMKLSADPQHQRQRPRRVQRAMSQDHVLSPPRTPRRGDYGLSSHGGMTAAAYGSSRHLSEEQLLSADRLHSQEPLLLSPAMRRDKFREKAMARAMSHADMLMPTTPVMDRHKVTKMHSQPSASNDYNTLMVNHPASTSKRQAFASRRTHTVDHLQYIPGHHHTYRTASKNEVTV
ncbi:protein shisa-6-like isoform X3 [Synchiropus splendidus]|uniref:protein shisa-6-like isoform X3 n=1 Tax=Synchiropus splendidus TaxID=270530 RepID=UPI00237E111A|nr:protein shisa-6-like isoform X3 [Synchiropus splendidus]